MAETPPPQSSGWSRPATPVIWRRACVACTKAKRQCTKQVPSCRRCANRRIPCDYPPARHAFPSQVPAASPSSADPSVMFDPDVATIVEQLSATAATPREHAVPEAAGQAPSAPKTNHAMIVANIPAANTGGSELNWFLAQYSFVPELVAPEEFLLELPADIPLEQLLHIVDLVKKWLKDWVTDGHSPLHHRQLYRSKMPRCVQDAYSTMGLYFLAKGASNQHSIFRLIDDRVTQLLEDQVSEELFSVGTGSQTRHLLGQLSRVQSLMAYQTVRLFDGDIRMRARAEADIPTLLAWSKDLLAQTRRSVLPTQGGDDSTSPLKQSIPFDGIISGDESVVTWKLWILTESIRRTWLTSNMVMEVYHYFKNGWSQCPGLVPFTMRLGLWDAETAYAWSAAQRKQDALFTPILKHVEMMQSTSPSHVDEFSHAILGVIWGLERMAKWHDGLVYEFGRPPVGIYSIDSN